jgi:SHS2 domain-containing protein
MLCYPCDILYSEGEKFDLSKHPQGTEVKAITYSAMQIHEKPAEGNTPASVDVYVIVDI